MVKIDGYCSVVADLANVQFYGLLVNFFFFDNFFNFLLLLFLSINVFNDYTFKSALLHWLSFFFLLLLLIALNDYLKFLLGLQ